jgi:hypothetical protein
LTCVTPDKRDLSLARRAFQSDRRERRHDHRH